MQQKYTELYNALLAFRTVFEKRLLDAKVVEHSKHFFREVSTKPLEEWSYNDAFRVYGLIKPYAAKLKLVGFDFSSVPAVLLAAQKQPEQRQHSARVVGFDGAMFVVSFPYSEPIFQAIKSVPGRTFEAEKKTWRVPLSSTTQLKHIALGFNFEIGERALQMMNNVHDNLESSYSAEFVELGLPVKKTFYPFQTVGIDYGRKNRRVIIGDQMGLGKTIQGIGIPLATDSFPTIVICPKSLRLNWQDEWKAWTDKRTMVLTHKNFRQMRPLIEAGKIDVVITNYDGIETFFVEEIKEVLVTQGERAGTSYDLVKTNGLENLFRSVILDEAHNCRNKKTLRYKCIKKVFDGKDVRVCLTGTPIVKSPADLAALLELIGRIDEFGGYYSFMKAHKDMDKKFLNVKDSGKLSNQLRELNIKLRSICFIRREKYQVIKDMPEKFRRVIRVPLDNRKEYDHAFISLQSYLSSQSASSEQIASAMRAELLVQYNLLKRLSAKGKFSAVKEFAEDVLISGEKLIIFCWFNETVEWLLKALPGSVAICGKIAGRDVKDEEIHQAKARFQTDPSCRVIILTYGKGGEGHTLTAASKVAFIEMGWTYKDQAQAEDRAHRIGQLNDVECYYFLGEDTLDEHVYKIIDNRRRIEKETTGGTEEIETTFGALTKQVLSSLSKAPGGA